MTFEQIETLRDPLIKEAEATVRAALEIIGEQAADLVEAQNHPLPAFLDKAPMEEALARVWTRAIVVFADETLAELSPTKSLADWIRIVQAFVELTGGSLIRSIRRTTLDLIRAILEEGVLEGFPPNRLASEIRSAWPEISRRRAETIARTETIRANNYGALEGAKRAADDFELDMEKVWVTAPLTGTDRDRHVLVEGLNGQKRGMDDLFDVNGHPALRPLDDQLPPEESINCRCAMRFEVATKSYAQRRNIKMRALYHAEKARYPFWVDLVEEMARDEGLAFETVRKIVHSGA